MLGTDYTNNSTSFNQWNAYGSGDARFPDVTTTWYTTNDATLEITGCQLEVGSTASPFVHEPYEETLRKCQRYYAVLEHQTGSVTDSILNGSQYNATGAYGVINLPVLMRSTAPTLSQVTGTDYYLSIGNGSSVAFDSFILQRASEHNIEVSWVSNRGQGNSVWVRTNAQGAKLAVDAEI